MSWKNLPDLEPTGPKRSWRELPDAPPPKVRVATESAPSWASEQEVEPKKSLGDLATEKVRAGLQGATFGYSDELAALAESALPGTKSYRELRDEYRQKEEAAAKEHPLTAAAGGLAAPIPGAGSAKGLAGLGRMAIQGAALGGLAAGGASHADLTQGEAPGFARDVGVGSLVGGAVGAGLGAAGKALAPVGRAIKGAPDAIDDFLRDWAEKRAVKAVAGNAQKRAIKELNSQGLLNKVGRYALDEGVVSPFSTPAKHLERAEALSEGAGEKIQGYLSQGDAAARPLVSGPDLATQIRRSQVAPLRAGNQADQALADRLESEAARLEERGDLGFQAASKYKNTFDKYLKHGAEQSPIQEELKGVRRLIKRDIEGKLDAVGDSISPGLGDKYRAAKESYGLSSELADLAKSREEQLLSNKMFGINAHQAGGAMGVLGAMGGAASGHGATGAGIGGMAAAGVGMLGHKLADEYGPQLFATGLNLGSKVWTNTVVRLAELAPESLGKYGGVLARELQLHGPAGVLAMHNALSGDPQYVADQKRIQADLRAAVGGDH